MISTPQLDRLKANIRTIHTPSEWEAFVREFEPAWDSNSIYPGPVVGVDYHRIFDALTAISPYPVSLGVPSPDEPQCQGTTDHLHQSIVIKEDLDASSRVVVLAHELAHALLHGRSRRSLYLQALAEGLPLRALVEVEAEGTAYLIANALGIDTTHYSASYCTSHSLGSPRIVDVVADTVHAAAAAIIDRLPPELVNRTYKEDSCDVSKLPSDSIRAT